MIIDRPLNIRHAALGDLSPIAELLAQNALPYTDLIQSKVELIVAYDQDIHLLTETAQDYWAAKGFKKTERSMAPENISSSSEFGNLCPSSAIYMVVEL